MPVMPRCALIVLGALGLASCAQDAPAGDGAAQELALQPILSPDITRNKLHGTGCAFVADGGGIGAVLLAQDTRGVIKVDNALVMLAPDPASATLAMGSRARYTGNGYAVAIKDAGPVTPLGTGQQFKGKLEIADATAQPVYAASGDFQCRAI